MAESQGIFTLFNREEFLNYLSQTSFTRNIRLVQNHHTYSPDYAGFQKHGAFALLNGMRNYHIKTNGWREIGQNITTFPDGTIAICRPLNDVPACITGANANGIGMEHVGNFGAGTGAAEVIDKMTDAHRESIIYVNAALCKKFKLVPSADTIVYHHWYDLKTGKRTNGAGITKTCPGTTFFGGNKVEDAEKNFIPLIKNQLKALDTVKPAEAIVRKGVISTEVLNVRDKAGTEGRVLQRLKRGVVVNIYYEVNWWYKISAGNNEWVSASFVQIQNQV